MGNPHGARLGCEMTVLSNWETNQHPDYDWFQRLFANDVHPVFPETRFVTIQK